MNINNVVTLAIAGLGVFGLASAQTIYSSIPNAVPGNVASLGYEATSTYEFGDHVKFVIGTSRQLKSATVLMSSWGCESGSWVAGNCSTTPGASFTHPITLNIYAVASGPAPGALLLSKTVSFSIPYRPSASGSCSGGRWYSVQDSTCYNGFAAPITFDVATDGVTLPDEVIWGVAYNTTHYGSNPIGEGATCYSGPAGCGYDALNVGAETIPPLVGTDVEPNGAFWNTTYGPSYCDGGAGGVGVFRLDDGCWTDNRPMIRFAALQVAKTGDDCKKGGWTSLLRANGTPFRNQGDCVSYTQNGK